MDLTLGYFFTSLVNILMLIKYFFIFIYTNHIYQTCKTVSDFDFYMKIHTDKHRSLDVFPHPLSSMSDSEKHVGIDQNYFIIVCDSS
jgi:hypothetical protein